MAALYVVFQHIWTMVDPYGKLYSGSARGSFLGEIELFCLHGHFAVAAFIVISGFCLQMSLYRRGDGQLKDFKRFFARRCERILPPYYACLILSLIVAITVTSRQVGLPWSQYVPVTPQNVISHLLMVHNLIPSDMYRINGVLWSISIEFQLYFMFPLFCAVLWRYGASVLVAILSVVAVILLAAFEPATKLYVWFIPLFGLGMVAARFAFDPRFRDRVPKFLGAVSVGLFLMAFAVTTQTKALYFRDPVLGLAVAVGLLAMVQNPVSLGRRMFGSKVLVWLGGFSYSLYLMHHPVLQLVYLSRPVVVSTPLRQLAYCAFVGLPIILAVCFGFYWLFERPFLNGFWTRRASSPETNSS